LCLALQQQVLQFLPVGNGQFGSSGGRGGAQVGGEIGNREIGFVADAADDRCA
jgi:hypothetical protein